MPIVGTHISRYNGGHLEAKINFGTPSRRRIKTENKKFWIKLPHDIAVYDNNGEYVFGNTVHEVSKAFDKIVSEYYAQTKGKRKVIAYKFSSKHLVDFVPDSSSPGRFSSPYVVRFDKTEYPTQAMELEFNVGYIITIGEKQFYSKDGEDVGPSVGKGTRWGSYSEHKFIDWTKEREAWFVNTYSAMTKLIESCKAVFDLDEKGLALAMNKIKLLK